ncbi:uncharacterized protein BDZ99DRAFT_530982 [Mytilinidion resinicola]|uniref:Uncharacterized protein n=1 Tax=Mytilinidion resinicola TaxID=574789 RepID=A0A6A6ZBT6_9PEZI|nr:uncharacterized protein BDZ99DRAFT_530982 [Mytilinidion resinicola]KAF2817774.1 hypothetical protein BDZ99DRAFT_530982 [Mytilinidion resinicola]
MSFLLAAPPELRQKILDHASNNKVQIRRNGSIYIIHSDLKTANTVFKEDIETVERLWIPRADTTVRITSPSQLCQLPAVTQRLKDKAAAAKEPWYGFQEIEIVWFHNNALQEANNDRELGNHLARTIGAPGITHRNREIFMKAVNVGLSWSPLWEPYDGLEGLDPNVTRALKYNLTMPTPMAMAVSRLNRDQERTWWDLVIRNVRETGSGVEDNYESAQTEQGMAVPMEDRKDIYPRIELVGTVPGGHGKSIRSSSDGMMYTGGLQFA